MKKNFKQLALFNFEGINLNSFVQNKKLLHTHTQGKIWILSRISVLLMLILSFTHPTWSQSNYCGHTVPTSLKFFEDGDDNLVSSACEAKKSRNGIPVISNICNDENGFIVYVKCVAGDQIGLDMSVNLSLIGHFEITGTSGFDATTVISSTSITGRITRSAPGNYEEYCASFTVKLNDDFVLNSPSISFAVVSTDHLANDNVSGTGYITFFSLVASDDLLVDEFKVYSSATSASTLISTNVIDDLACFQPLSKLLYFKDDLTIDVDACFDPGIVDFKPKIYFAPGKKMVVQTGKTAKLRVAELGTCEVDKWTGIEGTTNSIIDLDDVTIDNALIGINTYNTKLDIKNSEFKNSGTGIRAYGSTDVLMFDNNHLHDLDIGIDAVTTLFADFTPTEEGLTNTFENCDIGIKSVGSRNVVSGFNTFEDCTRAVLSHQSHVVFAENNINNSETGVDLIRDVSSTVDQNTVTNANTGLRVLNNASSSTFLANNNIEANQDGILAENARRIIINSNQIEVVQSQFGLNSNAIFISGGNKNSIDNNIIDVNYTYTGINSTSSDQNYIRSNNVTLGGNNNTNSIFLNSSTDEQVSDNMLLGGYGDEAFGIHSSGGNMLKIDCNVTLDIEEAFTISHNSLASKYRGNSMLDHAFGFRLVNSIIGQQAHHGNRFETNGTISDLYAEEMTSEETFGSQFVYDKIEEALFEPYNPVSPNGDISRDEALQAQSFLCENFVGSTTYQTWINANICDLLLKLSQNLSLTQNRKALFEMYMRYIIRRYFPNSGTWPQCVQTFVTAFGAGHILDKVYDMRVKLDEYHNIVTDMGSTFNTNLASAGIEYVQSISKQDTAQAHAYRDDLISMSAILEHVIDSLETSRESKLAEMDTLLAQFDRNDTLVDAYYIAFDGLITILSGDTLSQSQRTHLDEVASMCLLEFTGAVHQARGVLAGNSTIYDDESNCVAPRERHENRIFDSFEIYPNPTKDILNFNLKGIIKMIEIRDMSGRLIQSLKLNELNELNQINVAELVAGIYTIEALFEDGQKKASKFIKIN